MFNHKGDPWSGATYRGCAGGPAVEAARPGRRPFARAMLVGGVVGALALGVLFGFLLRPELIGSKPPAAAAPIPVELATPAPAQVPIAVSPPPATEPIPRAPGKLQTLPPEMEAAARAQNQPRVVMVQPPPPVETDAAPAAVSPATAAEVSESDAPHRASFDCDTARPGAEEMVCSDASLASADRQMARAYRRALASGFEPSDLRQEQRDWVAIREDAARHSQRALADVYDQRTRELNEIAAGAPADDGE